MNILFLYGVGGGCGGGGGSAESLSGFDGTWIMAKPRQACSLIKVPVLAWSKLRLDLRLLGRYAVLHNLGHNKFQTCIVNE